MRFQQEVGEKCGAGVMFDRAEPSGEGLWRYSTTIATRRHSQGRIWRKRGVPMARSINCAPSSRDRSCPRAPADPGRSTPARPPHDGSRSARFAPLPVPFRRGGGEKRRGRSTGRAVGHAPSRLASENPSFQRVPPSRPSSALGADRHVLTPEERPSGLGELTCGEVRNSRILSTWPGGSRSSGKPMTVVG